VIVIEEEGRIRKSKTSGLGFSSSATAVALYFIQGKGKVGHMLGSMENALCYCNNFMQFLWKMYTNFSLLL
jgi:hypothetical protein